MRLQLRIAAAWMLCLIPAVQAQNAWINEFHYDNSGSDVNEFVEIVIENAHFFALSDFALVLYNGNGGTVYQTHTLDTFSEGTKVGNYTFYAKYIPGIQNGAPDGMALCYQSHLVQLLSYEGTFTAADGCAAGVLSTDIGVMESGSTPQNASLQLTGSGARYADFTWSGPATASPGAPNTDQELTSSCTLAMLGRLEVINASTARAQIIGTDGILVVENSPTQPNLNLQLVNVTDGSGTSTFTETSPGRWAFTASGPAPTEGWAYYQRINTGDRLNQFFLQVSTVCPGEPDGMLQAHLDPSFDFSASPPTTFAVLAAAPNPFHTRTVLTVALPQTAQVSARVLDLLGREVASVLNASLPAGMHSLTWEPDGLSNGIYLLRLEVRQTDGTQHLHTQPLIFIR